MNKKTISLKKVKPKIMTILGTRPEIIRLCRVLPKLDKYTKHVVVYTNQNFSYELKDVFFKELGLRKPDYTLEVKAENLGGQIGNIISQTEKVILKEKPNAILILGDTNSSLSAIIAKRLKIPIFHMEAGNRSFDKNVPEEINRKIVDHISDWNLAYTEHARRYLLAEGIRPETIFVTGSPFAEIIENYKEQIENSNILKELKLTPKQYFVVSLHREENVDIEGNLLELSNSLNTLCVKYNLPVIVSLHPRTAKRLKTAKIKLNKLVVLHKPFGLFAYNKLQKNSKCVLSDSGTIQEESAILGFSAIQVRNSTERPEAFDAGTIILSGLKSGAIINAVETVADLEKQGEVFSKPKDYFDTNVSTKVVKIILSFTSIN